MTSNIMHLSNQLNAWVGRKVTVTVTDRAYNPKAESPDRIFTDTPTAALEASLQTVTVSDDHLVVEYSSANPNGVLRHDIMARGHRTGIRFHREFNQLAIKLLDLTGVKVPTGVTIILAEDCGLDKCEDFCGHTSRTEVQIMLR